MRASALRPSGEWNDDDFDVLANGAVSKVHAALVGTPWMWSLAFRTARRVAQDFRANRFDTILMQRTKKDRNGNMVMRYATKTINIRPSIPRMRKKRGESLSTNTAGTDVTMANMVSLIQLSIFSIPREDSSRAAPKYISMDQMTGSNIQVSSRRAHGYAATREAAMSAFAKSWRRE
jgi:hypothetical protein